MLISIHRRVQGFEVRDDFRFHAGGALWVYVCQNCGATSRDTLTPVEMVDDNEENAAFSGATLCEACGLAETIREGWAALTFEQVSELWSLVRKEQARDAANQAARERSVATTLDDLQRACAALQQAPANQGVDRVGA